MKLLCVCIFLAVALSYASGCGWFRKGYVEKSFEKGVYISASAVKSREVMMEILKYSRRNNDQNVYVKLGPLITQMEKPCKKNSYKKKLVFSWKLPDIYTNNPPMPISNLLKIDYQLGSSNDFYVKNILPFPSWFIRYQIASFMQELSCEEKPFQRNWYYIVTRSFRRSFFGYSPLELWIPKTRDIVSVTRKTCPPDDSDIEELCTGNSGYSCPNMTFEKRNGVSVRKVSMYIVTGEPTSGVNCSFDSARFSQYMNNHHYFMGNNSQSKKVKRTIPVMTKALRILSEDEMCEKKYQMQFYVNTEHLDKNNLPCPTQPDVMLQKVSMQIYVKTFNGNPNTDMSQVKDRFMKELNKKEMLFNPNAHYIAQYRGHGPMFGRTMEIWVEKSAPEYETICQGFEEVTDATVIIESSSTSVPATTTPEPTITTEIPDGSNLISYY